MIRAAAIALLLVSFLQISASIILLGLYAYGVYEFPSLDGEFLMLLSIVAAGVFTLAAGHLIVEAEGGR